MSWTWNSKSQIPVVKILPWITYAKGQIKSEQISEIINFPKNDPKNLKDS